MRLKVSSNYTFLAVCIEKEKKVITYFTDDLNTNRDDLDESYKE